MKVIMNKTDKSIPAEFSGCLYFMDGEPILPADRPQDAGLLQFADEAKKMLKRDKRYELIFIGHTDDGVQFYNSDEWEIAC